MYSVWLQGFGSGIIFSCVCFVALTLPFLCRFLRLEQEMCVKVLSQYNNLVHTTSRTGHLSLALIALIKPSLQEANCSTFCRLLCFYWLTHVQPLEPIKNQPSLAHTHTYTHNHEVCMLTQSHILYTRTETRHVSQGAHLQS